MPSPNNPPPFTPMKKTTDDLVAELLNGDFDVERFRSLPLSDQQQAINDYLASHYELDEESLMASIKEHKSELENLAGIALSDEQLNALTAGKSNGQVAKDGAIIGGALGGAAFTGVTVAAGTAVIGLVIGSIVFK